MTDTKSTYTHNPFPRSITSRNKTADLPQEYVDWKADPTPKTLSPLLKKMDPVIDKALKSYGGTSSDALRTKARLMSVDYFNMYDPKKGMALPSYIYQNLKGLNREKAKRTYTVHVPENVLLNKNRLYQATKTFESEYGREPNLTELADITSIPRKAIEHSRQYKGTISASSALTEKGDTLFSKGADYEKVWTDYVYFDMDPLDKKIFEWTTGYGGARKISKGETARKLNITPAAVSLRINKIVKKLEEAYGA